MLVRQCTLRLAQQFLTEERLQENHVTLQGLLQTSLAGQLDWMSVPGPGWISVACVAATTAAAAATTARPVVRVC